MKLPLLIFTITIFQVSACFATEFNTEIGDTTGLGNIEFIVGSRIDSLEKATRGRNELRGYRIQIYLGPYAQAKNERTKFMATGINLPAYMPQNLPDYAVRVGDFRTMMEAQKYMSQIRDLYPSAFVVPDKIEPHHGSRSTN